MLAEIEDFIEGFNQPTWRGMRVNGERVPVWVEPAWLEWALNWEIDALTIALTISTLG
jgi:hypothetical protein